MEISKSGLDFIKNFEGFYATAYDDLQPKVKLTATTVIKGTITLGYGTTKWETGAKVKWNDTITKEKAETLLKKQVEQHCVQFKKAIKIEIAQEVYNALASFSYNCGAYAITNNKTMLNAINNKKWDVVAVELKKYNKSKGIVLNGLVRRRAEEVKMIEEAIKKEKEKKEKVYKTTANLNLREKPSLKAKVIKVLPKGSSWKSDGTTVKAEGITWVKLGSGYASKNYLKEV